MIRILAFASPPAPGQYQLEYAEGGPGGVPANPLAIIRTPVTITAAAPTPASTGSFTMENRSIEDGQIWTYSGGCYVTMKYVKLDVVFHTSAELEPFREVSGYEIKIDGRTYNSVAPPEAGTKKDITIAPLHAACDGDDRQTGGLSLGTHTVSMVWHPAGATTDFPEAITTVELGCDATPPSGAGATPATPTPDAGAPSSEAAPADDGGGCSATGRPPFSAAVFALFAFFGMLACRRNATSYQHRSRRDAAECAGNRVSGSHSGRA